MTLPEVKTLPHTAISEPCCIGLTSLNRCPNQDRYSNLIYEDQDTRNSVRHRSFKHRELANQPVCSNNGSMLAEPAHRPRVVMLSKTFRQGLPISRGASHGVAWLRTICMATHSQAVFSHGGRGCIEATTALRQSKQPHSRRHCACRAVRPRSLMVLRAMKDSKPADFVSIFLPSFKTKPPVSGAESAGSSGTSGKASEISFEGANRQPYEASGQSSDATAKGTAPAIPEAVRSPQSGDGDKGIISGGETVKLSGSSGSGGKLPPGIPRPGAGGGGETPEDGPRKAHYGSLSFLQVCVGRLRCEIPPPGVEYQVGGLVRIKMRNTTKCSLPGRRLDERPVDTRIQPLDYGSTSGIIPH